MAHIILLRENAATTDKKSNFHSQSACCMQMVSRFLGIDIIPFYSGRLWDPEESQSPGLLGKNKSLN
jgi:hypothetical protein